MTARVDATDAAYRAGISREKLVRLIQQKKLKGTRENGFWYVDAADLTRYIREAK